MLRSGRKYSGRSGLPVSVRKILTAAVRLPYNVVRDNISR